MVATMGTGVIPSHLAQYEFNALEDLLSALAVSVEDERTAVWLRCDLCAVATLTWPGDRITGKLAETLSCSSQAIRRYAATGRTFPPDVRAPDRPLNLYYYALQAPDPLAAVQLALDKQWSPRQLREYLRRGDSNPQKWCEILHLERTFGQMEDQQIEQIATEIAATLWNHRTGLLVLKVHISGLYPSDPDTAVDK